MKLAISITCGLLAVLIAFQPTLGQDNDSILSEGVVESVPGQATIVATVQSDEQNTQNSQLNENSEGLSMSGDLTEGGSGADRESSSIRFEHDSNSQSRQNNEFDVEGSNTGPSQEELITNTESPSPIRSEYDSNSQSRGDGNSQVRPSTEQEGSEANRGSTSSTRTENDSDSQSRRNHESSAQGSNSGHTREEIEAGRESTSSIGSEYDSNSQSRQNGMVASDSRSPSHLASFGQGLSSNFPGMQNSQRLSNIPGISIPFLPNVRLPNPLASAVGPEAYHAITTAVRETPKYHLQNGLNIARGTGFIDRNVDPEQAANSVMSTAGSIARMPLDFTRGVLGIGQNFMGSLMGHGHHRNPSSSERPNFQAGSGMGASLGLGNLASQGVGYAMNPASQMGQRFSAHTQRR